MISKSFLTELKAVAPIRQQEMLSRHTTFGIGGPADVYLSASTQEQLQSAIALARAHSQPVFILGSGSNIIVSDLGIRGLVIENQSKGTNPPQITSDGSYRLWAETGISLASLARRLSFSGYAGLEWASGIPGTLGGAVVYNAGAYGSCLQDVLNRVRLLNEDNQIIEVEPGELSMGYRGSAFTRGFMQNKVVLAVDLSVREGDADQLRQRVRELDARRTSAQPKGLNAGSTFKNPPEHPAWWLIDQVGLRGYRIGDAQISDRHTNFFTNRGKARATDVLALMNLAQERIQAQFGIQLEPEITMVGEGFNDRN